jgi:septal ring factor EnvC (AmiA/AmiB activator)
MYIKSERLEQIYKDVQDFEDEYARERQTSLLMANYVGELEGKIDKIEKERDQFKEQLMNYIKSM